MKNKTILYFTFPFLFLIPLHLQSQEVVINEFLASNSTINTDPDFNEFSDWIELYNPQDKSIDLSRWFLTDDLADTTKWQVPDGISILSGDYLIFWADNRNENLEAIHSNFKLSKDGGVIFLYDSNRTIVDSISYKNQYVDISFGRQPDGGPDWVYFETPSPGSSNLSDPYLKTTNPQFSLSPGFYTENQTLVLSNNDPLATIRYTTNGDEPTESSPVYTAPLQIQSRSGEANVLSMIRTNRDPYLWLPDWVPPEGEVFKATIIRARSFRDSYHPSDIVTGSYFVDPEITQRYATLPVISLNTDYENLFDNNSGIYVPGVYHQPGNSGSGNYFQDWEKPAHIELFEPGGNLAFKQDVGISIQGGTSPASPQKGLHVIARSEYGKNRISYPIFKNDPSKAKDLTEYKRFIIRAWGSLITGSLFNDAYAHRLMAKSDLDIMAYQPAIVFINGEYWGIHELREASKNSWYYQYHYNIDRDDPGYDILIHTKRNGNPYPEVDEGDDQHWNNIIDFINRENMNLHENYDHLKTLIDIDNFITYMGHCIYVGKWDWPNNNDASWRPRTNDGKWKWIQYDMETSFGVATNLGPQYSELGPQINMLEAAIRGIDIPGFERYGPHPIFKKIYTNEEFKRSFLDWFDARFINEFHPDTMNLKLDYMAAEIRPYMEEYKHRWPFINDANVDWENSIEQIKEYNRLRPDYMKSHLLEYEQVTSIDEINLQQEYKLFPNYPNPFNLTTRIDYRIPAGDRIVLEVFNSQGQKIESFSKTHAEGGRFFMDLNMKNQKPGIYFYTLKTDNIYIARKMSLIR